MNDHAAFAGMLPFDSIGLYEQPKPRFIFKMPRVVPDQKAKFESDELFRRLSRESEVSTTFFNFILKFDRFLNFPSKNKMELPKNRSRGQVPAVWFEMKREKLKLI